MFYTPEALKRGGRFYHCWVADSWPLRFATMSSRQLACLSVPQICDDLREVVESESGSPGHRFSLRLSIRLIRGLTRIYRRQCSEFLAELCMMDATILKYLHKREERIATGKKQKPHRGGNGKVHHPQREVSTEQVEEIGDGANVVADPASITLREEEIPERPVPIDGFGDEQLLQTLETMLGPELTSHLDMTIAPQVHTPLRVSQVTAPSGLLETGMLGMSSNLDLDRLLEKDIMPTDVMEAPLPPPASPVPAPVLPAPVHEEIPPIPEPQATEVVKTPPSALESLAPVLDQDMEEKRARKRKPRRLCVDVTTYFSTDYMRAKVADVDIECRELEIATLKWVSGAEFLRRSARGWRFRRPAVSSHLVRLFSRNLAPVHQGEQAQDTVQVSSAAPPPRKRSAANKQPTPRDEKASAETDQHDVTSKQIDNPSMNIEEPIQPPVDITGVPPTEMEPMNIQLQEEAPSTENVEKRRSTRRRSSSQAAEKDVLPKKRTRGAASEVEKTTLTVVEPESNIPHEILPVALPSEIPIEPTELPQTPKRRASQVAERLAAAGLEGATTEAVVAPAETALSETPLGSLDRTKVSLGGESDPSDSIIFMRDHWGPQGTILKIISAIKRCTSEYLTVESLVAAGPVPEGRKRMVVARCFTSILKLKQIGFLKITKNPVTLEIVNIELGERMVDVE